MELLLRGDEQIVVDYSDNSRLKEIRGVHLTNKDGSDLLADVIFYDARIIDGNIMNIEANYVIVDGEKRAFEIVCR